MSNIDTKFICEIAGILRRGLGSDEIYEAVFQLLEKTVPFDSATLFLYDQRKDRLEMIHHLGEHVVELAEEIPFERGYGLSNWISTQRKPIIIESLAKARAGREGRFNSFVSMPLWSFEGLIGVLNLGSLKPGIYHKRDVGEFEIIATQVSLVLEKMLLRKQVQDQNEALKRALEELESTQTRLIEKERLAAIGEIIVTVNHEINNPLAAIIGLAEILDLTVNTADLEKIREAIKAILAQAKRIRRLTHRLTKINSSETQVYVDGTRMTKIPL